MFFRNILLHKTNSNRVFYSCNTRETGYVRNTEVWLKQTENSQKYDTAAQIVPISRIIRKSNGEYFRPGREENDMNEKAPRTRIIKHAKMMDAMVRIFTWVATDATPGICGPTTDAIAR